MQHGTAPDYALLDGFERQHAAGLADRLLGVLERLDDSLGANQITRLQHSVQSATRARLAGANIDWVVAALSHRCSRLGSALHDIGDELAHHLGGDRSRRDDFADHPWFDLCVAFCAEWDQNSFDPNASTHDLASFADDVRTVFARTAWDADVIAAGPTELVS